MVDNPTLYMLVGVPGAGKSTWIANQKFDPENTLILSTDKFIDAEAAIQGKTYSQVFSFSVKRATSIMNADLKMGIMDRMNLVWDQTNTSAKARASKLASIPDNYRKVAVFFPTPEEAELERRLASRAGKTIPPHVMRSMASNLEMPTKAEGFDEIITVG